MYGNLKADDYKWMGDIGLGNQPKGQEHEDAKQMDLDVAPPEPPPLEDGSFYLSHPLPPFQALAPPTPSDSRLLLP